MEAFVALQSSHCLQNMARICAANKQDVDLALESHRTWRKHICRDLINSIHSLVDYHSFHFVEKKIFSSFRGETLTAKYI